MLKTNSKEVKERVALDGDRGLLLTFSLLLLGLGHVRASSPGNLSAHAAVN